MGGSRADFPTLASFLGKTLSEILGTGSWSGKHDSNSSISSGTRNTVLCPNGAGGDLDGCTAGPSETGGFLIVLANLDQSFDSCKTSNGCDAFKIKTLVGEVETRVPEPGTLMLLGSAMAGLVGFTRMRGRHEEK